jgi:hypothetical protein
MHFAGVADAEGAPLLSSFARSGTYKRHSNGILTSAGIDHESPRPSYRVVIPNRAPSPVRNLLSSLRPER